jgi:hypothetical protein
MYNPITAQKLNNSVHLIAQSGIRVAFACSGVAALSEMKIAVTAYQQIH